MATILIKKRDTTGAPATGDLTNSSGGAEIAVNTFDKRLYAKDSGGTVVEIGTAPSTIDINAGTIDGTVIGGATAAAGTFTTATATTGNITTVNATTVDTTNIEVTNIKAKDGTAAASIADSTGKITVSTELAVDNLNLSGNTLSTTDTDGDLILSPDGDGVVQEEVGGTNYDLASQFDVGTAPNQIPLNQYLGDVAYLDSNGFVIQPQASAAPAGIGDMVFQLTSNTSLEIKVKGSDGTVRSVALTLA